MSELLKSLNIKENNYGACHGPEGWIDNNSDKVIKSFNPSNGHEHLSMRLVWMIIKLLSQSL